MNLWASWCGPVPLEFPFMQRACRRHGTKVAFLGVNSDDSEGNAARMILASLPMPYPSVVDDRANLAGRLGARGLPVTVFYDADGKQEYVHQGAYPTEEKLSEDIEQVHLRLMIEVREARDDAERAAAMAIRHTVFVDEQDVPVELEVDGLDDGAAHLVAVRDGDGRRDLPPDRPRCDASTSAVSRSDASARRQGIAGMLVQAADEWAREHGADRLMLSAQTYAADLYLAAGYIAVGKPYLEAGIEHVDMELELG